MLLAFHIPISEETEEEVGLPPNSDKTIHVVIYSGFGLLMCGLLEARAANRGRPMSSASHAVCVLLMATAYGYVDEVTQPFTGRNYDLRDFYADIIGTAFGIAAYYLLRAIGLFRRLGLES
jgi:VanZ family protein